MLFKLEDIIDSSLNISGLFNQFNYSKYKIIAIDSSGGIADKNLDINNIDYENGIIIDNSIGIEDKFIRSDVSGNLLLMAGSLPNSFLWKGIHETYLENVDLKGKITNLENLVSQLIGIIDPSIVFDPSIN